MPSKLRQVGYIVLSSLLVVSMAVAGLVINVGTGAPFTASIGLGVAPAAATAATPSNLNVTPGSDATQLCFSWASANLLSVDMIETIGQVPQTPEVQIGPAGGFPGNAQTFYGQCIESYVNQTAANPPISLADPTQTIFGGFYQNKVTVAGLAPATAYEYRVGDGTNWIGPYNLMTQSPSGFSFLAVGDPQLGAAAEPTGTKGLAADTTGWLSTVSQSLTKFPNVSFLLSLGDEVNNTSSQATQDQEYAAYFSPPQLTSIPVATIEGNHDFYMGPYYSYHYNLPNQSTQYGATEWGNDGDYWFTYGNALFMVLNSNNESITTHDVFMGKAIAANPDATWRIVAFHHSLYSEASHTNDPDILFRRSTFPAVFDKYHIDVVMSGHDHSYTRTYQMLGGMAQTNQTTLNGSVVNPTGTVYFTLDSGSGSKFYAFTVPEQTYSAFRWQEDIPTFSYVSINGNNFSIVTYRTDNMSVIDKYSIAKNQ